MNFPKLVIASDGRRTAAIFDGVFIGQGIECLELSTKEDEKSCPGGVIRLMEISVRDAKLETGETAKKHFTEFMEDLAKENRPCRNKDRIEVKE